MSKQGDHVFNDLETAIPSPIEALATVSSPELQGQSFLDDHLLHTKSLMRRLSADQVWQSSRIFTASDGDEEDVLRELGKLGSRLPALPRLEPALLKNIHSGNANQFGEMRLGYERDFYHCLRDLLTVVATGGTTAVPWSMLSTHISFQKMVTQAYDPAAALVVIAKNSFLDNSIGEGPTQRLIEGLATAALANDPGTWVSPFERAQIVKPSLTKKIADQVHGTLRHRDWINVQGQNVLRVMCTELTTGQNPRIGPAERREASGYMLHLVDQKIRQMQSRGR